MRYRVQLLGLAGGAELDQDVVADLLAVFEDGMDEAGTVAATAGQLIGYLKIAKRGDKLPAIAVELPNLELFKLRHEVS